jgi:hypothetical protein
MSPVHSAASCLETVLGILQTTQIKLKQSLYTPWRYLVGTRWGWVVSVTPRPRFIPEERTTGTHCPGGWVGPRAGLNTEDKGKILSPLSGIEHRSPGRPARSQTLYWLSYPGSKDTKENFFGYGTWTLNSPQRSVLNCMLRQNIINLTWKKYIELLISIFEHRK